MQKQVIYFLVLSIGIFVACNSNVNSSKKNEEASCTKTIKDPNHPKPMALMMRAMANHCDSMRLELNAGKTVDSLHYPLMPFWKAEPTDSANLVKLFYDNAAQFEHAYNNLMRSTEHQKENYTLVINSCINCHNSFCSGPLRRIRKLPLDYKE